MLRRVNNALFMVFIVLNLFLPGVYSQTTIPVTREISNGAQMELIQNEVKVTDLDIEPINTGKIKETIVPDPQKEGKKVIGLFLKTMAAVAFCAIVLYLILLFIKKFYASAFINNDQPDFENFDLASPDNRQDALKSFLNRTK